MFVNREFTHTLAKENNKWVRTTKVKYSYPRPTAEYNDFVKRYQDWFRFYLPEGAELVSLKGNEVEVNYTDKERGKVYYGGFMTLAPEETKEIEIKYYIPEKLITNGEYNLYVQKQSGTRPEKHSFDIMGEKSTELKLDSDYKLNVKLN
jgi:formylglycine-generating enzyme required for sulfatase activity